MASRTFTVLLRKEEDSQWIIAECLEVQGAVSQGKNREEALRNIKEAIEGIIEARAKLLSEEAKGAELVEITIKEAPSLVLA